MAASLIIVADLLFLFFLNNKKENFPIAPVLYETPSNSINSTFFFAQTNSTSSPLRQDLYEKFENGEVKKIYSDQELKNLIPTGYGYYDKKYFSIYNPGVSYGDYIYFKLNDSNRLYPFSKSQLNFVFDGGIAQLSDVDEILIPSADFKKVAFLYITSDLSAHGGIIDLENNNVINYFENPVGYRLYADYSKREVTNQLPPWISDHEFQLIFSDTKHQKEDRKFTVDTNEKSQKNQPFFLDVRSQYRGGTQKVAIFSQNKDGVKIFRNFEVLPEGMPASGDEIGQKNINKYHYFYDGPQQSNIVVYNSDENKFYQPQSGGLTSGSFDDKIASVIISDNQNVAVFIRQHKADRIIVFSNDLQKILLDKEVGDSLTFVKGDSGEGVYILSDQNKWKSDNVLEVDLYNTDIPSSIGPIDCGGCSDEESENFWANVRQAWTEFEQKVQARKSIKTIELKIGQ